jgi:hypothetical protein
MRKFSLVTYHASLILAVFFFMPPLALIAAETAHSAALRDALAIGKRERAKCSPELLFESAKNKESELAGTQLRVIRGRHIHLITDLPRSKEIDRLPQVFDAAVPLWMDYFRLAPKLADEWKMLGILVGDPKNFASTTLLRRVPNLQHGFSVGNWLWIREQESDYYRRHLLLHEGVHGLKNHFFGFCGPNWYMEGLAELLGTQDCRQESQRKPLSPALYPIPADIAVAFPVAHDCGASGYVYDLAVRGDVFKHTVKGGFYVFPVKRVASDGHGRGNTARGRDFFVTIRVIQQGAP